MILGKIGDMLGRAVGLVDDLHTSDEERLTLKERLLAIQAGVLAEVIKAETATVEAQARIIEAEAKAIHGATGFFGQLGQFLTSTWRPITMLSFLSIIMWSQIGGTPIPDPFWEVIQFGLGGYVVGRSLEKTVPATLSALKSSEK